MSKCTWWIANADSEALIFNMILDQANYFGALTWLSYVSDIACPVPLLQSTSKSVLMMTQRHSFSFTLLEDLQAKILGIPYKNNDLSMFVLLPNDIDGLEKVKPCIAPMLLSFPEALHPKACSGWAWKQGFWFGAGVWQHQVENISHSVQKQRQMGV